MKYNPRSTIALTIFAFSLLGNLGLSGGAQIGPSTPSPTPSLTSTTSAGPKIVFKIAGCWVIPEEHKTGVYVDFFVTGISVDELLPFFVYSSGEHVKTYIFSEIKDPSLQAKEFLVNPLLSGEVADINLCPKAILITAHGDLVEASVKLNLYNR